MSSVFIIGGGPVGGAMATVFRKGGYEVSLFDRVPSDIRSWSPEGGRSINLVLTRRGLRLAEEMGCQDELLRITTEVRGRTLHHSDGTTSYTPYGKEGECNYSIDRTELNRFWISKAETAGCSLHYDMALSSFDLEAGTLKFQRSSDPSSPLIEVSLPPTCLVIGCDGGGSRVRQGMKDRGWTTSSEELLDYVYKEVSIPPLLEWEGGEGRASQEHYLLDMYSLHIWPKKTHFLMGLANLDGSFTGTVYAPGKGAGGMEEVFVSEEKAKRWVEEEYGEGVLRLIGDAGCKELASNRAGILGTVRCQPWFASSRSSSRVVVLAGDASHAIVPFFGQGCNSGFEDCYEMMRLLKDLKDDKDFLSLAKSFFECRKENTDAIADLALDNFEEMMTRVADKNFLSLKKLENAVMSLFPGGYRSRYTCVMYSYNPYSKCLKIGETNHQFLEKLKGDVGIGDEEEQGEMIEILKRNMQKVEEALKKIVRPKVEEIGLDLNF